MKRVKEILHWYNEDCILTKAEAEMFLLEEIAVSDNIKEIMDLLPSDMIDTLKQFSQVKEDPFIIASCCAFPSFDYDEYIEEKTALAKMAKLKLVEYFNDL